jgi:protein-tyrosine-phosphatase
VDERVYKALFLCTGNSARSILAEALIEHWGKGRFKGHRGGSFPKGTVHPLAMDFVFTVCDQAVGETRLAWPGNPITAHWGVPDPAAVDGTEAKQRRAFREAHLAR